MIPREPATRITTPEELRQRIERAKSILEDIAYLRGIIFNGPADVISAETRVWLRSIFDNQENAVTQSTRVAEMVLAEFGKRGITIAKIDVPIGTITVDGIPL